MFAPYSRGQDPNPRFQRGYVTGIPLKQPSINSESPVRIFVSQDGTGSNQTLKLDRKNSLIYLYSAASRGPFPQIGLDHEPLLRVCRRRGRHVLDQIPHCPFRHRQKVNLLVGSIIQQLAVYSMRI